MQRNPCSIVSLPGQNPVLMKKRLWSVVFTCVLGGSVISCKRHVNPENQILNTQISFEGDSCKVFGRFFSESQPACAKPKVTDFVSKRLRRNCEAMGPFASLSFDFRERPVEGVGGLAKVYATGGVLSPILDPAETPEPSKVYQIEDFFEPGIQAVLGYELEGFAFEDTLAPLVGLLTSSATEIVFWKKVATKKNWKKDRLATNDLALPGDLVVALDAKGAAIHFGLVLEKQFYLENTPTEKGSLFRIVSENEFLATAKSLVPKDSVPKDSGSIEVSFVRSATQLGAPRTDFGTGGAGQSFRTKLGTLPSTVPQESVYLNALAPQKRRYKISSSLGSAGVPSGSSAASPSSSSGSSAASSSGSSSGSSAAPSSALLGTCAGQKFTASSTPVAVRWSVVPVEAPVNP